MSLDGKYLAAVFALCLVATSTNAAEVHSNGLGGGDWSDPLSWREKAVPTPEDDAVIARGDVIEFDRDDVGKTTCKQIFVDPGGSLTFKTGSGKLLCCVAGQIESYGAILIDGSRSSTDKFELRMTGATPAERTIKLRKDSKLTVNGRRSLTHGRHNVTLSSAFDPALKQSPLEATIDASDGASLDVQRAQLPFIHLQASDIDNTGAEPGERVNVLGNHFTGGAHLTFNVCDTPLAADNLFEYAGKSSPNSAILVNKCQLAEIRDNVVRGGYPIGVQGMSLIDSTVTGGEYEGTNTGVYWAGTNCMLKNLKIRNCKTGLTCTSMTGAAESIQVENCSIGYYHTLSVIQMTDLQIDKVPQDGVHVSYYSGRLSMLNCNITPEQIKPTPTAKDNMKDNPWAVESLSYLVVRPKGNVPAGARVEVRSAEPSKEQKKNPAAADPNVRNSPAPLRFDGLTPLPNSLEPLIVKGWMLNNKLKPVPAPSYTVNILPAASADSAPKPLASQTVTPDASWYRAEPNKPEPTLEVTVP